MMAETTSQSTHSATPDQTTWLYMDEAGNFDFSGSGSRYLILTCVAMHRPFMHIPPLISLKYDCLAYGINQKVYRSHHEFHATEDVNPVRNVVFSCIEKNASDCRVYSAVLDKRKLSEDALSMPDAYSLLFGWLVHTVRLHEKVCDGKVIVVTDIIKAKGKNEALRAALKRHLKREFTSRGMAYLLYQHQSESDLNLQLADYCCWAIQRKWEHGDPSRYKHIADMVVMEASPVGDGDSPRKETDPPIPNGKSTTGDLSAGRNV